MKPYAVKLAVLLSFIWMLGLCASAQTNGSLTYGLCPTVTVTCPNVFDPDRPLTFTANISGADPAMTPTYRWEVPAGHNIVSGQGTHSITVETGGGNTVTATVTVDGLGEHCPEATSSCSMIFCTLLMPLKIGEYGNTNLNDERARLDNFAIEWQNYPGSTATIIAYGGRHGRADEVQARTERAKAYLTERHSIDPERITIVNGGLREDLTVELWIVPVGSEQPQASPTADPNHF